MKCRPYLRGLVRPRGRTNLTRFDPGSRRGMDVRFSTSLGTTATFVRFQLLPTNMNDSKHARSRRRRSSHRGEAPLVYVRYLVSIYGKIHTLAVGSTLHWPILTYGKMRCRASVALLGCSTFHSVLMKIKYATRTAV